ncbi:MAG: hypothetical protein P4L99_21060 [Chthoniobacter sp.]|nr:hypothetical protein [Chthoniobacter sp.]
MKTTNHTGIRSILVLTLMTSSAISLSSCSTHDTATRQQGVTDAHTSMIDRREARQEARDARFKASRESWMN